MTPKEYRQQEIKKFIDSLHTSMNENESINTISTEMYVKKHKLISYEECKRKLGLSK